MTGSVFALRPAIALVALAAMAATAALAQAADAAPLTIAIKDGTVPREQRVSTVMAFKAFASGRFAVHAHEGQARGGSSTHAHGRSVLLRLEVQPQ